MTIRTFEVGDELAQVSIYNDVAGSLPRFKPATVDEVRRRCRATNFDPRSRLYAVNQGRPVGYITFQRNGRLSYPWCRKGHENHAEALLDQAIESMRQLGIQRAFAAYRRDWPNQRDFFLGHGFSEAREMINYVLDLIEMPTPAARASSQIGPLTPVDVPAVLELGAGILRVQTAKELEVQLFQNHYFSPSSLFALRSKMGDRPVAVGIVVANDAYANPSQLDADMPCFRLGAFGTEGMTTKRINGLFSFLAADNRDLTSLGLDMLSYATNKVADTQIETFAAQVPSDVPHLARFYKSLFRRQGSFPIFERAI